MKAIRSKVDLGRLRNAAKGPGTDTREWCKYGLVVDTGFDPAHGIFVDLKMIPNGEEITAYVGAPYAGKNFGEWNPIHVDDMVEVLYPEGTAEATPIVGQRLWQAARVPPPQMQSTTNSDEPTDDKVLVVEPGQKYKIYVSGGGSVEMYTDDDTLVFQLEKDQVNVTVKDMTVTVTDSFNVSAQVAAKIHAPLVECGDATAAPVAKGAALQSVIAALQAMATSLGAATDPAVTGAATALTSALGLITDVITTELTGT